MASIFRQAFNAHAPRDVLVNVEYITAQNAPSMEGQEKTRFGHLRDGLPAHLKAMAELDRLYQDNDKPEMYQKIRDELRKEFWGKIFDGHTMQKQSFAHQLSDSLPYEAVQHFASEWENQKADMSEAYGEEVIQELEKREAEAARKILAKLAGGRSGMLRLNFIDALVAGQEPDALIDKTVPFPATNKFLKTFMRLDAVVVAASITHAPALARADKQPARTTHVNIHSLH